MTLSGSVWETMAFRVGLALLVVGWAPLLLYIAWAGLTGEDGNPIGLGLLMVFSTPSRIASEYWASSARSADT